jgi:hypothetical protein
LAIGHIPTDENKESGHKTVIVSDKIWNVNHGLSKKPRPPDGALMATGGDSVKPTAPQRLCCHGFDSPLTHLGDNRPVNGE